MTDTQTDTQTHRQTDASDLIICPMLCNSNETDNNKAARQLDLEEVMDKFAHSKARKKQF